MNKDKINKINIALSEAERFIKRASAWKSRLENNEYLVSGTKEGGAAKRSSLDLTRALTEMRN